MSVGVTNGGVNAAIWVVLLLQAQTGDTVRRSDPLRTAYQDAVDACQEAERLLATKPEAVIEKLAPLFAESLDKNRFTLVEQRLFIEAKSQEFTPSEFYPYHLRGKARLLVARKKQNEEARQLLIDAAADLQTSVTRGALRSKEPLAEVKKELWDNLRVALEPATWKPGGAGIGPALIAAAPLPKEAMDWVAAAIDRVDKQMRELRSKPGEPDSKRPAAKLAAEWCQAMAAFGGATEAAALKTGALAVAIRDSRGNFRLKIGVSPWARVIRLERQGEEIPLADRDTPLLIPRELEIGDYTVELDHPSGKKTARIPGKSLEPGRTYVLWGDMSGNQFDVAELSK